MPYSSSTRSLFAALILAVPFLFFACQSGPEPAREVDICIYGGTSAGIMAAYSAKMLGKSVLLIEPGTHLGGLSSGGLGQTDIGNKYAVTGLARDFYRRLGDYYGEFEVWQFEPKAATKIFDDYLREGEVEVWREYRLLDLAREGQAIRQIRLQHGSETTTVRARVFLDCTYEGDLLALAGCSYTVGREANSTYGETYNGVQLMDGHQFADGVDPYRIAGDPASGLLWGISDEELAPDGSGDDKVQAYNFRVCLTDSTENRLPITMPEDYDPQRYELLLRVIARDPSLPLYHYFIWSRMPNRKTDINNRGPFSTDMIGMNWDYPEADFEQRAAIVREHENYTKGLFFFLGNDPRVPVHIRDEMQKWGYPRDEYPENSHWSPQLYVREARRLVGEYVMTEHNCVGHAIVDDGIGLAAYTMDSHNCQRLVVEKDGRAMVRNEGNVEIGGFGPYPIAYRSLTPKRGECTNLLVPVCLSASHIAFGSIRMEPVFMVLGQSAAVAAALAVDSGLPVQEVPVAEIQRILRENPLLDGSIPEIQVDNADSTLVEYTGGWTTQGGSWQSGSNRTNHLLLLPGSVEASRVRFVMPVTTAGRYRVYYYCPGLYRWSDADGGFQHLDEQPDDLPCLIRSGEEIHQAVIPYRGNERKWVDLGAYQFAPGQNNDLEVIGDGVEGYAGADAVLLVAEGVEE